MTTAKLAVAAPTAAVLITCVSAADAAVHAAPGTPPTTGDVAAVSALPSLVAVAGVLLLIGAWRVARAGGHDLARQPRDVPRLHRLGLSVIPRTLLWLWDDHAKRKAAREYEHHLAEAAKRRGIL